jgi:hypothetical protein
MVGRGQGLSINRINTWDFGSHSKTTIGKKTKPFTLLEGIMYSIGRNNIF